MLVSNSLKIGLQSLKFGLNWQFHYFKPTLSAILVTIATGKSKINARILRLGYSSNKPTRWNWWKATFSFCLQLSLAWKKFYNLGAPKGNPSRHDYKNCWLGLEESKQTNIAVNIFATYFSLYKVSIKAEMKPSPLFSAWKRCLFVVMSTTYIQVHFRKVFHVSKQ